MKAPKAQKLKNADANAPGAKHPAATHGAGRPLDAAVRTAMEPGFGQDFSSVRVHDAGNLGARAATLGRDIAFAPGEYAPATERGKRLIAHELAHVVQQSRGGRAGGGANDRALEHDADRAADAALSGRMVTVEGASAPVVQFKIEPEDAASEMVGGIFEVISPWNSGPTALAVGDLVKVDQWDADPQHSVKVTPTTGAATGKTITVPQRILRPKRTAVPGLSFYGAGVDRQAAAVEKSEQDLSAWQATKGSFHGRRGLALFAREEARLQATLTRKRDVLNRREIQEAMFNRFDQVIATEVNAANLAHGLTGADALDPELVKAQLFQESQMGTAGEHMAVPPTHPVKTRFNLGQVIDSSAMALLTLMEAEQKPLITKYHLDHLRVDLAAAQTEKARLEKRKRLTPAQLSRLRDLSRLASPNWETFIWQYKATGQAQGFNDAVTELFTPGPGTIARNLDYGFWIHLAIMWLFEKKTPRRSWLDTIRAYNGGGAAAQHYRAAILKRAADAQEAARAGKDFSPI